MRSLPLVLLLAALPLAVPAMALPLDDGAVVHIANFSFTDRDTNGPVTHIPVGGSVTWVWDAGHHSATAGINPSFDGVLPPAFDSGVRTVPNAPSYTVTFGASGVYAYYCTIHFQMRGVVVVAA
jgi:plastocyanin